MPTVDQGRQYYRSADPVHDFQHIQRVLAMAERIGTAEGADLEILRAAVLLHDAAGATPSAVAGAPATHHEASAAWAREILQAGSPDLI
jgi:uncharacterized protein